MTNLNNPNPASPEKAPSSPPGAVSSDPSPNAVPPPASLNAARQWWIKLLVQPLLLLVCGAIFLTALGIAQRVGWISAGGGSHQTGAGNAAGGRYICPMMCTPPQASPGRCPVCAMELVPATSAGGAVDPHAVRIDAAARRVANIRTVPVASMPITRTVRAIGELSYDEGTLKTISAYVDGRLERLYADYTGVVVKRGDQLALLYSPRLYASQVELLLARKARDASREATLPRVGQSNQDLYASARQRLLELGMTASQIEQLEQAGEANSRLQLSAPISGTVIEKLAVEGAYVKEGDPIYKLADLSTVWLMLELYPEDVAAIRYGQKVEAEVQSLPGRRFAGRVAFIDPNVDSKTRTVGVRVVMPNEDGALRIGDYAKATMDVPLSAGESTLIFDPELANKWVSPRHPHVIRDEPGSCPICGIDLVPAAQFGFSERPSDESTGLVVPRDAVLMAGDHSVVYVETEPGRFEIRPVVLGPNCGEQIVIRSGLELGERVAARGNFLIDSQMQLAGNPSLIDPSRLQTELEEPEPSPAVVAALAGLSAPDRETASQQQICPVAGFPLGSMGTPLKVDVNGRPVFICCELCRGKLLSDPDRYLAKLAARSGGGDQPRPAATDPPASNLPPIAVPRIIDTEEQPQPEAVPEHQG